MVTDLEERQNTERGGAPDDAAGAGEYVVGAGECLHSIAHAHGFFWETLWNHPDNAGLKRERRDPGVLLPGDRVTVPALTCRLESCQTEARHRFRRRGVPARLRVRVLMDEAPTEEELDAVPDGGSEHEGGECAAAPGGGSTDDGGSVPQRSAPREPRACANQPYVMDIDGTLVRGSTDGEGWIDRPIPPGACRAVVTLRPADGPERVLAVCLGHLDPVETVRGVQQRLRNLGHDCALSGDLDARTGQALRVFQAGEGLVTSGEADEPTRQRLRERHGS